MGRNRNINPIRTEPLTSGFARRGFDSELLDNGNLIVNISRHKNSKVLSEPNILIKLRDVFEGYIPAPVNGGIVVGDDSDPSEYIVIPPGMEGQALKIIGGVPTWGPDIDTIVPWSILKIYADVPSMIADQALPQISQGIYRVDDATADPSIALPVYAYYEYLGTVVGDITDYKLLSAPDKPAGQEIYDGLDTEANILAMNPTLFLGQVWWATDTKTDYRAITSVTVGDHWQNTSPATYNLDREYWSMPTTGDGQTLDLGQETFIAAVNADITVATELNPKVFAVVGVNGGDSGLMDVIKVEASDIGEGTLFGINTVQTNVGGVTKITTFGLVNGVNTIAWGINDVLYIDPITKGELTNVKPITDAWIVGVVLSSNALTGTIMVLASNAIDDSPAVIPAGFSVSWFTGDLSATAPFYDALGNDKGIAGTVTQTVVVNDNQKLPIPIDFLTLSQTVQENLNLGQLTGQIEWSVSAAQAVKKVYLEVYHADAAGAVIDVPNALPVGDLGVRPFVSMESSLVDPSSNTVVETVVDGLAPTGITLAIGERLRYHVLFEKVGAQGGAQTFTLYQGNLQRSFLAVPVLFALDDLLDVSITAPVNDQVLTFDAASGNWQNKTVPGGGGGTPGGLTGAIQYNDSGAFGGEDTELFWDKANNRVGIGTIIPGVKLDVHNGDIRNNATGATDNYFILNSDVGRNNGVRWTRGALSRWVVKGDSSAEGGANAGTNFSIVGFDDAGVSLGERFFISRASGNIGIGTIAPSAKLSILHNNSTNNSAVTAITLHSDSDAVFAGIAPFRGGDSTLMGLAFQTHSGGVLTNSMVIRETGNVGIGTVSPLYKLHVTEPANHSYITVETEALFDSGIRFISPTKEYVIYNENTSDSLQIRDQGAGLARITIATGGDIGIGTTNPIAKLHIKQSGIAPTDGLEIENQDDTNSLLLYCSAANAIINSTVGALYLQTTDANRILINSNGNVQIFAGLQVDAAITCSSSVTATNFQLSSDMRDKTKVQDLGGTDFKYFSFKRGDEPLRYGVSAQQIRRKHPELVSKGADGKLAVSYIDMLVLEVARLNERLSKLEK